MGVAWIWYTNRTQIYDCSLAIYRLLKELRIFWHVSHFCSTSVSLIPFCSAEAPRDARCVACWQPVHIDMCMSYIVSAIYIHMYIYISILPLKLAIHHRRGHKDAP